MPNNKVAIENIISMLIYIEKWMKFEIIVGIPLLTKAMILGVNVGIKINYHLLTSIYVTSILSYTVLSLIHI